MTERVTIRVDADTKDAWEDAVESTNTYSDMTHLVKLAVSRELAGEHGDAGEASETVAVDGYDPEVTNAELRSDLRDMNQNINRLLDQVTDVKKNAETDVMRNASVYLQALPTSEDDAVPAEEVASRVGGVDSDTVESKLGNLMNRISRINVVVDDDGYRWYKEV